MSKRFSSTSWKLSSVAIASLVCLPILTLVYLSFSQGDELQSDSGSIWQHLVSTVLPDYVLGSLQLMSGVAVLTLLLGVGSAWIVTQYDFTGRRFFNWALLMPLAMPAYITAYSYTGLLDSAGVVQSYIRSVFGLDYGQYWFPEIRSMGGAIAVMSFVLYPYIFLLARSAFLDQSMSLSDASRLLGCSRRKAFFQISLPIARPAIMAGLALVLMETLADFGTVSYFGISTFTTGIFRTWYGLDSISSAAQLSLVLLSFVVVLLVVEKSSRNRAEFYDARSKKRQQAQALTGFKALCALCLVSVPLLLGFIIPTIQLLIWSIETKEQLFSSDFWWLVEHTFTVAALAAIIAVSLALIVAYSYRNTKSKISNWAKKIASLGYAIPGMVIAIGVLIPLVSMDKLINTWSQAHLGINTGLLISGSVAALIIAYVVRFLAVSLSTVESGLLSIKPSIDQSAKLLGASPLTTLFQIHLPLIRGSVLTALLVVFVDVMKELPATLVLRPFNFNTLAVKAHELAADERLADAALPSLAIVLVGLLPVILLTKAVERK